MCFSGQAAGGGRAGIVTRFTEANMEKGKWPLNIRLTYLPTLFAGSVWYRRISPEQEVRHALPSWFLFTDVRYDYSLPGA